MSSTLVMRHLKGLESLEHSEENLEDFFAHYGIVGMRWGVRRSIGSDGYVERGGAEKPRGSEDTHHHLHLPGHAHHGPDETMSADHERVTKALEKVKQKGIGSLSNEELKAINNRAQAEAQVKKYMADQKEANRSPLEKAAKKALPIAGKLVLKETQRRLGAKDTTPAMLNDLLSEITGVKLKEPKSGKKGSDNQNAVSEKKSEEPKAETKKSEETTSERPKSQGTPHKNPAGVRVTATQVPNRVYHPHPSSTPRIPSRVLKTLPPGHKP